MGIGPQHLQLYMQWADLGWFDPQGGVLDIGAQQLFCVHEPDVLEAFVSRFGGTPFGEAGNIEKQLLANGGLAGALLQRAGFRYLSIDYNYYQFGIRMDLNRTRLPQEHCGIYGMVTNIGTSEHILNQWNVFETMHDAVSPGGIMYHSVPCCGDFEHGIINYNAKFWWALCKANGYERLKFTAWFDGDLQQAPASFGDTISGYDPKHWRAATGWVNVLLRKVGDRPFAGLMDPAFG